MRPALLRLLAVAVGLAGMAWAQDDEGPGRGVARISVINGDVSVRRGDTGDWIAAAINAPLVVEDRLTTGTGSRAEVQFDWANMIRLASSSEIRLSELENGRYQVQVASGLVTFRVLRDSHAQVELCTPSVSVRPLKKGIYRIEVREDGTSEITVRSGEAEIFTPHGSEALRSGHTMMARGSASDPEFQVAGAPESDDWDGWNAQRDQDLERSRSYQHVNNDISGAEDLDGYGTWVNADSYGWVWRPRVTDDWAPYRQGRWVWVDWYGWTWVSYDPWGWAPYHYGRWFNSPGYGWCWWPGGYGPRYRHYWSPGLVAFFGWGSHSGGGGFGHVGWVPLGPHEPYHRWYGNGYYRGGRLDSSVHMVNNVNLLNTYRNARVRNGMTGINTDGFVRGRQQGMVGIGEREVRGARLVRGVVPIAPGRESLRMADRQVRADTITRGNSNQRFFSTRQPARVDRVAFDEQRRGLERIATRTAGGGQTGLTGGRLDRGAAGAVRTGAASGGGWRRAESVDRGTTGRVVDRTSGNTGVLDRSGGGTNRVNPQGGQNSGWRRFGAPARATEAGGAMRVDRGTDLGNSRQSGQGGWRQVESGAGNSSVGGVSRISGRENYQGDNAGTTRTDSSRWGSPRSERSSDGPVRINPQIVRERTPSYERSGGSSSGGGGGRSMSSPSSGGSRGGGGSSRGGGGGGGSSRGGRGR
jgi:hypothetical protein